MPVTFALGATPARAEIPALCAGLTVALEAPGSDGDVRCDVTAVTRPDAVTVELLARLSLTARRHGGHLLIVGAGRELFQVAELLGLRRVLTFAREAG